MLNKTVSGTACACLVVASFSANATLVSRLGGLAYYDTESNLTWLANANANGLMDWDDAMSWAAGLNVAGVTGWRLPDTIDVGNDGATYINVDQGVDFGFNITTHSELSNMFFNVLGNASLYDTSGVATGCTAPNYCLTNTGPFSNLQSDVYWSATEYAPDTAKAWIFDMYIGYQESDLKTYGSYAWAVRSGDVSAVPVPATAWLFGSGLLGLISIARRKKS